MLTPRELEIVRLLLDGYRMGEIAEILSISRHTVKHHLSIARGRTGSRDNIALAVWACRKEALLLLRTCAQD